MAACLDPVGSWASTGVAATKHSTTWASSSVLSAQAWWTPPQNGLSSDLDTRAILYFRCVSVVAPAA
eukprot:scaffold33193_cov76-Amphora_coffeaeformis.AAC.1